MERDILHCDMNNFFANFLAVHGITDNRPLLQYRGQKQKGDKHLNLAVNIYTEALHTI